MLNCNSTIFFCFFCSTGNPTNINCNHCSTDVNPTGWDQLQVCCNNPIRHEFRCPLYRIFALRHNQHTHRLTTYKQNEEYSIVTWNMKHLSDVWCVITQFQQFLPPYSPNLNPIEQGFSTIKAYIHHHWNNDSLSLLDNACQSITPSMLWDIFVENASKCCCNSLQML